MTGVLHDLDARPEGERWPEVRRWIAEGRLDAFAELRDERPVLVLPEVTVAFRHADCALILEREDLFSAALYAPKQGAYWMAQDDTPQHWREKSIMRAVLDREEVPAIAAWVGEETARRLEEAGGAIDLVDGVARAVPVAMVQHWFGFDGSAADDLRRWSYWNQMDAFWNQPFDAPAFARPEEIVARREAGNEEMRAYLIGLVQRRAAELKAGGPGTDMVSRLLRLSASGAVRFDLPSVVLNIGGLLIGAVETTSHAVVNALDHLLADPDRRRLAREAAADDDPARLSGVVFEALRFRPAFPYFFRVARADVVLGKGSAWPAMVPQGAIVLALTHSAMFDAAAFDRSEQFDPGRDLRPTFTFGLGQHECLGRAISAATIPAIVREILKLDALKVGPVDRRSGPVPEAWPATWA